MRRNDDLADQTATLLIAADLWLFRDFILRPDLTPIRGVAELALMPFLSAFVFESAQYLRRMDSDVDSVLRPHRELLRASRQRLKLLDDSKRSFTEILKYSDDLVAINASWFSSTHREMLAPLKRRIQPDLGIYFVQDEVVCTTHVAFLNLGLSQETLSAFSLSLETLGTFMNDTAVDLGRYVGQLPSPLEIELPPLDLEFQPALPSIRFRDVESGPFYESMARNVAPGRKSICILLMAVLSQVNTARILVPMISGQNGLATFKIGFLSLFHAASSLQRLLDHDQADAFLHPAAVQRIDALLQTAPIESVRQSRGLRNNLVHYRVSRAAAAGLSDNLPLFGLVEALMPEKSFTSLTTDVELGLDHIANRLRELLVETLTPEGTL
jgi:hypothetical protein